MSQAIELWNLHGTSLQPAAPPQGPSTAALLARIAQLEAEVSQLRAASLSYQSDLGEPLDLDTLDGYQLEPCGLSDALDSDQWGGLSSAEVTEAVLSRAAKYGFISSQDLGAKLARQAGLGVADTAYMVAGICEGLGFEQDGEVWQVTDCLAVIEDRIRVISQVAKDAPSWWRQRVAQTLLKRRKAEHALDLAKGKRGNRYVKRLESTSARNYGNSLGL